MLQLIFLSPPLRGINIPRLLGTSVLERYQHVVKWENLVLRTLQPVSAREAETGRIFDGH